ncbi:MAG TPA: hypothetical protein VG757_09140 [Devosia sp.]|nr:hypothetical protein [Devosia sp.]
MSKDVGKFVRIQAPVSVRGKREVEWHTIPLGDRVSVWEMVLADAVADEVEPGFSNKRYIFHIGYLERVSRGCLVTYMGSQFTVLSVSESTRLRGLEMRCAPLA